MAGGWENFHVLYVVRDFNVYPEILRRKVDLWSFMCRIRGKKCGKEHLF